MEDAFLAQPLVSPPVSSCGSHHLGILGGVKQMGYKGEGRGKYLVHKATEVFPDCIYSIDLGMERKEITFSPYKYKFS